jgi:DNA polymerase
VRLICLDFETVWSDDYTLKKLTTEAYVRDPRFEIHGLAIKWGSEYDARWYDKRQWRHILEHEDWSDVAIIAHHAQFDGLILNHHFGVRPALWLDTLSMARLVIGNHVSVGLDSLAKHFGLAPKSVPYNAFKGKRWSYLPGDVQRALAEGARHDVELTWTIFSHLQKGFPRSELPLVDLTVRMFTEPVLRADVDMLAKIWTDENERHRDLNSFLGVGDDDLHSSGRFAALLEAEGVDIVYKDGKNGPIPAFAANDDFMKELQEDENPRVSALASARLGAKSTLLQTRAETLGFAAHRGPLPVYLRYCGAHTTRWSGGDKTNFQNLSKEIAPAILPPEGFLIASPDASQIECRILNYLAGQEDKVQEFRDGKDPYIGVASAFYGREITSDMAERQAGKVLELQCGFGSGAAKIESTFKRFGVPFSDGDGLRGRDAYRATHPQVVGYWRTAEAILNALNNSIACAWGPLSIKGKRIYLPNGAPLIYDTLEWHEEESGDRYWRHRTRQGWQKIYGAKLVENVVQALARLVVAEAMLRIKDRGYRIANMRHDDIMVLVPKDGNEARHLEILIAEVAAPVAWLPNCPLAADGELSERYSK